MKVCTPPAVVDPDFVAELKVKSLVTKAFILIVFPTVAPGATSAVMKIYPVVPLFMVWDVNEGNVLAPAVPGVVRVLNSVAVPALKVLVV